MAVAQFNGCEYCLSAHAYPAANFANLEEAEIAANRAGGSSDPKADAAVRFSAKLVSERGQVFDTDVSAVRVVGFSDAEIVEIVAHVALKTLTNNLNEPWSGKPQSRRRPAPPSCGGNPTEER